MTGLLILLFTLFHQTIVPDTIRIGLLVQDKQSYAARHAAELAIAQANMKGNSVIFKLETRDMEGPWGTGAKQTVNLVFNEEVIAVVGSVDGRNSHLAEQVSAKTRIPYISSSSGDPTLGQAFIPWYFSCVPNDLQVASFIISRVYKSPEDKVVIVSDDGYDSKMAVTSFLRECRAKNKPEPKVFYYSTQEDIPDMIINKCADANSVVFYGDLHHASFIVAKLSATGRIPAMFAPNILITEKWVSEEDLGKLEGVTAIDPGSIKSDFSEVFTKKYGYRPGPLGAYAYDAVNLLIEGIKLSGNDGSVLYRHISTISHEGVTGTIAFDKYGHRKGDIGLIKIRSGHLIKIED